MSKIMNMHDLGHALQIERRVRGLTQKELADLSNVSRQTIIHIECGNDSNVFTILKILLSLRCCFEIQPIKPDFTKLKELFDEAGED